MVPGKHLNKVLLAPQASPGVQRRAQDPTGLAWSRHGAASATRLTTNTSPLASFSTTYQGSRRPPILALWPKV